MQSKLREALILAQKQDLPLIYVNRDEGKLQHDLLPTEFIYDVERSKSHRQVAIEVEATHPLYVLYTSGSTGKSKSMNQF